MCRTLLNSPDVAFCIDPFIIISAFSSSYSLSSQKSLEALSLLFYLASSLYFFPCTSYFCFLYCCVILNRFFLWCCVHHSIVFSLPPASSFLSSSPHSLQNSKSLLISVFLWPLAFVQECLRRLLRSWAPVLSCWFLADSSNCCLLSAAPMYCTVWVHPLKCNVHHLLYNRWY